MALVRKAMVTGVTGSRPGSARARQQLSAEVEEAEELSEEEISEEKISKEEISEEEISEENISEEEDMEVEAGHQQLSRENS